MTRAAASEETNGRNGAVQVGPGPALDGANWGLLRRQLAITALVGNVTDAQTLYFLMPGATGDGWAYLERLVGPLRAYVVDGEPGYLNPVGVAQYEGTKTPEGDCAEDALPLEQRNPYRAAAKSEMANGATHA